jgi:hypothetical protein
MKLVPVVLVDLKHLGLQSLQLLYQEPHLPQLNLFQLHRPNLWLVRLRMCRQWVHLLLYQAILRMKMIPVLSAMMK